MERDPYFAGRPSDKSPDEQKSLLTGWCIVYGLKLIVPLYFGIALTQSHGRLGMGIAILLVFGSGCWVVSRFREIGKAINIGGSLVALLQIFPLLQVVAGMVGVTVARNMRLAIGIGSNGSELGGFAATVFTGGILITPALTIGAVVLGVKAWLDGPRANWNEVKKPASMEVL